MDMTKKLAKKINRETDYDVRMSGDIYTISPKDLPARRKKAIEDFERMRDMAELRALSNISLHRPLNDKEYNRMMELAKKQGLKQ